MRKTSRLVSLKPLIAVLTLGLVVRMIFLFDYMASPDWPQLLADSLFHDRWALSIASGHIFGHEVYFRAPFYVYILGLIYAVFGHSLLVARIFGHLIGLFSIAITYLLANRLFSRKAAVIAGIIHALYPVAIYFESELLVDSLFMMLLELSVLLFLIAIEQQKPKWYIFTGIIIGVAAITRPIILTLLPLYVIWLLVYDKPAKKSLVHCLILIGFTIVMIVPVTLRNLVVADDFVPIASSGGINFFIGNNAEADGLTATLPPPLNNNWGISDITYAAEKQVGHKMKASEISDFWYEKAAGWIADNPGAFIKLYLKKIYFMFNNSEISNNRNLPLFFSRISILKYNILSFGLIFSLAVTASIFLIIRKRFTSHILFICLLTGYYAIVISLFFVNARFRLPVVPFFIILSAAGIEVLADLFFSMRNRSVYIFAIAGGLVASLFTYSQFYNIRTSSVTTGYFNKANYYMSTGEYKRAIEYYQAVLQTNPGYPDANLNLGAVYLKTGQGDSAENYFRKELDRYPDNADAYGNLASLYNIKGEFARSQAYADSAIELRPYAVDPYLISLRNYSRLNDTLGIENTVRKADSNLTDPNKVNLDAGIIYSQRGKYDLALSYLQKVLNSPDRSMETNDAAFGYTFSGQTSENAIKARAAYQMGYIYGLLGNLEQSVAKSELAIKLDSNLVEAYINLINAYMLLGQSDKATALLKTARSKFPENEILNKISRSL